jgi:hypothetical protein
MAQRKCSLCGIHYADETGHDYDTCVERLEGRVRELRRTLEDTIHHLGRAQEIQARDWGRKGPRALEAR